MSKVIPTDGRHITYSRNQYRKCGKPKCRICTTPGSRGHGGYTYAYWYEGKKVVGTYAGKTRPHED